MLQVVSQWGRDTMKMVTCPARGKEDGVSRARATIVALVSMVTGAGVLALMAFGLASAAPHQSALVAQSLGTTSVTVDGKTVTMPHVALRIATYPDSLAGVHGAGGGAHPDWVSYSNDNLVVPAHAEVTMTIDQYDSGGTLNNPFFANVWGTIGGTASMDGHDVTKVDPTAVGHTFTLRGIPGNGTPLFVSVPLPEDFNSTTPVTIGEGAYPAPVVVKFSFLTGSKGVYNWNCEFPCGGSRIGQFGQAMSTFGYMSGTLTVK